MTQEKTPVKDFLGIRTRREALGMTLKDVYAVTRISVVNLEAIENGDFQNLPVPTYTKNFIKTYAQTLGMDSKPVLDAYEAYLNSLQAPTQKKQEKEPAREEEAAPEQEPPLKGKGGTRYKAYIAVVVILIIAAVAGIAVFQQQQPPPTVTASQPSIAPTVPQVPAGTPAMPTAAPAVNMPVPSAQITQPGTGQPVVAEVRKQAPAQPGLPQQKDAALVKSGPAQAVSPGEKKEPVLAGDGVDVLVIKATEETWLRITIDQNPPFQVLLKPGEVIKRKGTAFSMDIGNAGGVKVQFKGKVVENLGKSGEVVHLQLP
ncbi:MAG: RodZ domain-containing protein [Smithella sp.]